MQVKAHPILSSGDMVRALLDDRKRQARLVVTAQNSTVLGNKVANRSPAWAGLMFGHSAVKPRTQSTLMRSLVGADAPQDLHLDVPWVHPEDAVQGKSWDDDPVVYRVRPIYNIGDLLWVRETFSEHPYHAEICYRAEGEEFQCADGFTHIPLWRPCIHMPRWASRLTLRITDVRVERVQEILWWQVLPEGITLPDADDPKRFKTAFAELWNSTYGPDAWDRNDWVWVLGFEVIHKNVDEVISESQETQRNA